jgi:membrane-associated phospholipid phosphatase
MYHMENNNASPNPAVSGGNRLKGGAWFLGLIMAWLVVGGITLVKEENRGIYRAINEQHTPFLDTILPYVTHMGEATFIIPVLLLLFLFRRFRKGRFALALVSCNVAPFLVVQAIKGIVNAPRPLLYFNNATWINRVAGQPENLFYSFPSGHSEGSFALFCFLSLILPRRYAPAGILFFFIALSIGYSRMYLSQHFFADVYAGSLLGTFCCALVFWIINPFRDKTAA